MKKTTIATSISLALGLSVALPTAGQEQQGGALLEEIIVTADKLRARSLLDTPMAVSAIGGVEIEEKGFLQTSDLLRQMPGVFAENMGTGIQNINIRGVGSDLEGDASVGFYLDDMPFLVPQFNFVPDLDPYDLDRIEVLRGPQGTLYGASSLAGTVRVLTHGPVHNEFSGKVTGGVSNTKDGDDGYKIQGAVNIPLIDDVLSARLVGSRIKRGGYIDLPLTGEDDFNDYEEENYRVKVRVTPSDSVDINLSYWSQENDLFVNFSDDDFNYSPVTALYDFTGNLTGNVIPVEGDRLSTSTEFEIFNLNMNVNLGQYDIYATYSNMDLETPLNAQWIYTTGLTTGNDFSSDSAELRLTYDSDGAWRWLLGGFYLDSEGHVPVDATTYFDTDPVFTVDTILTDQERQSEQWAVFGEVVFEIVPEKLEVTVGARYFEDERTEIEPDATTPAGAQLLALGLPLTRSETFDQPTGRINLSYTPDDNSLYYLNIATGFRSGNVQCALCTSAPEVPLVTDPEDLISYEVGTKLQLNEASLVLDVALYYWEWDEIQVVLQSISELGIPLAYYDNVGKATATGLDVGLSYVGVEGLVLSLTGNINDAEYDDELPSAGIESGDPIAQAPDYSFTASGSYDWGISSGLNGSIYVAWTGVGDRTSYNPFGPAVTTDGYDLVNARAGIHDSSGRWSVYLTADNLLDDSDIVVQQNVNIALGGAPVYQRPRTLGLEASFNF